MCLATVPRALPCHFLRRAAMRKHQRLMMAACVLEIMDDREKHFLRGRMMGTKNIKRTRKSVESMWTELGCYARKAWRMSMDAFQLLHDTLEDALKEEFNVKRRKRGATPNGRIPTKLRLSAALRFFAGGSVYDIMLTHGMGKQSVYNSVYGIVNCVNHDPSFGFNANDLWKTSLCPHLFLVFM